MLHTRSVILLLMVAALSGTTSCGGTHSVASVEPAGPVKGRFSQEMLDSLLRQDKIETRPAPKANLWPHTVRHRRETFYSIALWYTGSGQNWPRLAEVNPNINPKRIHIGDTILIPEDLLKTQRLMPAGFPSSINRRRKIKNPQPQDVHPPAKIEEATLFGPIGNDSPAKKTEDNQLPVPLETIDR